MGLKSFFKLVADRGVLPSETDVGTFLAANPDHSVHVDLLGTFYYDILRRVVHAKMKNESIIDVGRPLALVIKDLFITDNLTIHIDRKPCTEKEKARTERQGIREKNMDALENDMSTFERNSRSGVWTRPQVMRRIQKGLREVHTLSVQDKDQLATGLSSVFDVCLCAYEADPCIGCHNEENDRIVISQDSDFFAYERVCILVRPLLHRRRKFGVYDVDNVIQALRLPSHAHLVLFCAIAGNDYSRNLETLGPVNNLRLIRKVAWNENYNKMLRGYLREASKVLGRNAASEEGRFRVALRIFTSGHQTSAQALPLNNEFDSFKQRLLNGKDLRHRMAQQRRAQRRRTGAPSFYIAEGSHRNQFRPVFSDKASILNGRTVDISNCRQHDRPGLKHPPRRKKAKRGNRKNKSGSTKARSATGLKKKVHQLGT
ncbi:hypothetical protein BCR41DRAFT_177250 [Lobosporangium transversale]|uniref:PIN domain-like protein n=1 Tax=Lobosporangium transversale TaxID=64571 RepID=A0A1Y2GB12_9FUNG|nr:hypothetical protein BCR41DRAFT_177250 [Lobosporangium transversale]ORZ05748.1 hypothetical protein BCR41DRAFT_177250 [Lobosporangium transversale]|eukprot:XP_021877235.1 hypothetical protein BCR41DRAFT_177250 [Lobosporangium transversale]